MMTSSAPLQFHSLLPGFPESPVRSTSAKRPLTILTTAPQEEVKQFKGIVVKRDPDSFTMSETTGGPTTTVLLTEDLISERCR